MGFKNQITSSQVANPKMMDNHFVRQVRNFMNNWLVEGGQIFFDGYRVNLKIDQAIQSESPHPWKLIKSTTALDLEMVDGILFSSAAATGISTPQTVSTTPLTLTNGTHKIWFKAEISNVVFATYFVLWVVDTVTVESGASVPADTLDLEDIDAGAGNVFVEIGEVVAADGEITTITQTLRDPYTLVFPLAIDLEEFECPEEEEPA